MGDDFASLNDVIIKKDSIDSIKIITSEENF